MLIVANLVGLFVADWVIPAIFLATVVELVSQLTGYRLAGLSGLLRQLGTVSLGLGLTMFLAVVSVFRMVGPVADSIFLRTGKFMANAFVPVVGKLFSDAAEVVFGSTFLLKNAVGIAGLVLVLLVTVLPILKLFAVVLIYRVAGALLGPVGAGPVADALTTMANNLVLVAVALGALAMMFYVAMTLVFAGGRGLV
jgi:stage III sporulation protein AE